ncbi:MAG: DNA recombination protein RmuC [Actinomycetota bacterium]
MEAALVFVGLAIVAAAILVSRRAPAGRAGAGEEAGRFLQARVDETATALTGLAGAFDERRRLEEQAVDALGSVERLIAGSYGRGRSGENLLAAALSEFPAEMVVRDFTVGGRVCEFALRMPDGKLLPIDSKWAATDLLELVEAGGGGADDVRRQVERVVTARLREVAGYIEPSLTVPLAVAAVPDAVYACCRKAHAAGQQARVLIVSYSHAVPLLLGMWSLYRAYATDVDETQLLSRLHEVSVVLAQLGERIEGHLSRGLKMAHNAALEMRSLVTTAELAVRAIDNRPGAAFDVGRALEPDTV